MCHCNSVISDFFWLAEREILNFTYLQIKKWTKKITQKNFKLAASHAEVVPWRWQDNQYRLVWNSSEHDTFQHAWSEIKTRYRKLSRSPLTSQFEKRACRSTVALLDKILLSSTSKMLARQTLIIYLLHPRPQEIPQAQIFGVTTGSIRFPSWSHPKQSKTCTVKVFSTANDLMSRKQKHQIFTHLRKSPPFESV
jgi:hypothetical protein